ncbi:S9 family peptidase [Haladaptatus sp. CMAA 1911]|uniref:S9 family peptidase n=1 Tax=unclassified Haladaptatus TaxID=2622732 RepID=UPI0037541691
MSDSATDASELEIPLEALASLPEFYHPMVAPDGERVACYYDGSGRNELCVLDVESGELDRLSDGDVPKSARWHICWDADCERIYFHRDDDGDEQNDIHALTTDGDHETLVEVDGQGIIFDVSPDGRHLLYGSDEGDQLNLYRYGTESGETEQLTAYDQPIWNAMYGPDGERIAFVTNETDDLDNRDVYVADADGSDPRRLDVGESGSETDVADWGPDGTSLLVEDNADDKPRAGVYDLERDAVRWLSDGDSVEYSSTFTSDGRYALVTRTRRAATVPVVYDLKTGDGRELDLPEGVTTVAEGIERPFLADGRIVLTQTTPDERKRLLAYDLDTDEHDVLLDAEYGDVDPTAFVGAEYVIYESGDWTIGGLLYDARRRPGADPEATAQPAVVMVHGGPHSQSTQSFNEFAQFLVSRGYTVFQPNYRGSTGRGREFKYAIRGDWGGGEQRDIAAGGRWLMDREWIDDDRVVVFGGSYGGYSAYSQHVGYPELWSASLALVGITDLERLYEDSMPHFQHVLEQQLGDPDENEDLYRERSPLTHVESAASPILMIHGVNDPRCPVSQARLYRDALQERGWEDGEEFDYEELGEEGHGSTDTDQKIRSYRIVTDYLGRTL